MNGSIIIEIRSVYGENKAYPACARAQVFAEIAGTKTLTRRTLVQVLTLGVEIHVRYAGMTNVVRAADAANLPVVY